MAVSQSVVFVAANTQADTSSGDPLALWTANGTGAAEAVPEPDSLTPGYFGTQPALSPYSLAGAATPGSLVLAFTASNGATSQLYTTDPATGALQVLDVPGLATSPTYAAPGPEDLTAVGPDVLFLAADANGLSQLWRSDGTAAGTVAVPVPGASASGLDPRTLAAFGDGALFIGSGTDNATDLFFTDGTTAGTREIAALPAVYGANQTIFQPLGVAGGREIFLGPGPTLDEPGLYATDGTAGGTVVLAVAPAATFVNVASATVGARVIFAAGSGLYATDGTAAGTAEISSVPFAAVASLGDKAVFSLLTNDAELGVTDGTAAGTSLMSIPGLPPGVGLFTYDLTQFGDRALFSGPDTVANGGSGSGVGLWITDGTATGTREIAPGIVGGPYGITAVAGGTQAYFEASDGLHVTDGTAAGTHLVPGTGGLSPFSITGVPSPLAFTGTPGDYVLAPAAAGGLQARDLTTPGAALLNLPDARVLSFGDGSTALFDASGTAEDIARIYLAAYSRAPDLAGLLSYTDALQSGTMTLLQVADGAAASSRLGANVNTGVNLNLLPLSNAQFLGTVYAGADGRAPDPGGLAAYTAALQNGESRGQVLLSIAESPEAKVHSRPTAGDAGVATITQLYEAIDGRAPDVGGLVGYTSALDAGQSVAQIAAGMLAGPEYASNFGSPTNGAFVTNLYHNLLGRAPDPGGLAAYTAALSSGETRAQLVAGFIDSDEARLATAPLTHLGIVTPG